MRRFHKLVSVLLLAGFFVVTNCYAGMPSFALRDVYRLRFQEISFFVFLLLACSWLFQLTWNHAAKGFSFLPRLTYGRAFSLALLFGLGMLVVLTMISGIREVLTPGAWRRQGYTYRLNDPAQESIRKRSIEHLRAALFEFARSHEGKFPPHDFIAEIPEKLWESPDESGSHYVYHGGLTTNDARSVLAFEPPNFGNTRFVLTCAGEIKLVRSEEIDAVATRQPKAAQ